MKKTSSITRTSRTLLWRLPMQSRWFVFAVMACACALEAIAQDGQHGVERALGAWYTPVNDLAPEQSRLVFYRPEGDGLGVITVHIDGRYHTSLQNGAYSALCLERLSVNLQAQPGRSWARADPAREVSQNVVMSGGQTLFVRLTEALATRPRMDVVPASTANAEVQATRAQMHSVSRVALAKPCLQASAPPSLVFAPEIIVLSAQSAQNPAELAPLIRRLESHYGPFKRVSLHIVGHADDVGSDAQNDAVSQDLAAGVQRYFLSQTKRFNPITAEGRGSKDRHTASGQPVRRVAIGVTVLEY
jgi:outer membrane protein OmpA-like peptidoglycan-associated protein